MSTAHSDFPSDGQRDHSLLITEAQQREFLQKLIEIEHDVRETIRGATVDTPGGRAAAERSLAEFSALTAQARRAARNAVTVEERIAHLDFEPEEVDSGDPDPGDGVPGVG